MPAISDQIPFVLGMFTVSGSPIFPAIVIDDEAVISIDTIKPLAASVGYALTGTESIFGLLQNWDHNFTGLSGAVMALNDGKLGKYYRSHFTSLEFFEPAAPIAEPRQIFCEVTGMTKEHSPRFVSKLPSTVSGPKAKILVAKGVEHLVAEVKLGTVISRPTYRVNESDAGASIAGYITVTDITRLDFIAENGPIDWLVAKSGPTYMPTGPYFVPAAFAGDIRDMQLAISFNGETMTAGTGAQMSQQPAEQIASVSSACQLFAGDIICAGIQLKDGLASLPCIGDGEIIETAISGLGQQVTNSMKEA